MKKHGNAFNGEQVSAQASLDYFNQKLACETDCSDVYQDIINNDKDYYLLDVRSPEAYAKSHATSAINLPHA